MTVALPETELVHELGRIGLPSSGRPFGPLDDATWSGFISGVHRSRLMGQLHAAVLSRDVLVTEGQLAELARRHAAWMSTALHLESLLVELVERLDALGIDHRVLKGSAAARLDYDDPARRCFGDVDLLVRGVDFDRVAAELASWGFERRHPQPRPGFDRRFSKGVEFFAPDGREVDVHRTLVMGPFGLSIDLDDLWADPETFAVGTVSARALGQQQRFVHACYHAALGDAEPRLVALRDMAEMLKSSRFDPAAVMDLAERWQGEAVVSRALTQLRDKFEVGDAGLDEWALSQRPRPRDERALRTYLDPDMGYAARCIAGVAALPWSDRPAYVRALLLPDRSYLREGRLRRLRRAVRELARLRAR